MLLVGFPCFEGAGESKAQSLYVLTPQKKSEVRIYLARDDGEYDPNNHLNLFPVTRRVSAAAPLKPTLELLLAGPTAAEKKRGYVDISFGIKLVGVKIKGDRVRADFTMPPGAAFSGDISPAVFAEAVRLTIRQFPGVKTTIVCLDGEIPSIDESGSPPQTCPQL